MLTRVADMTVPTLRATGIFGAADLIQTRTAEADDNWDTTGGTGRRQPSRVPTHSPVEVGAAQDPMAPTRPSSGECGAVSDPVVQVERLIAFPAGACSRAVS